MGVAKDCVETSDRQQTDRDAQHNTQHTLLVSSSGALLPISNHDPLPPPLSRRTPFSTSAWLDAASGTALLFGL